MRNLTSFRFSARSDPAPLARRWRAKLTCGRSQSKRARERLSARALFGFCPATGYLLPDLGQLRQLLASSSLILAKLGPKLLKFVNLWQS